MPRSSNTSARREQIARALQRVMAQKGYDGASIGNVAQAAGLAPGLVHYHFESKLDVLIAVLEGLVRDHDAGLDRALAEAGGDPRAELRTFIDLHLAQGKKADPDALKCWVTLCAEAIREPRVRRAYEAAVAGLIGRLRAIIARGNARRAWRCREADAAACAIFAVIQGYFVTAATARPLIPRGSAARCARRMAEGLLPVREAAPPKGARR